MRTGSASTASRPHQLSQRGADLGRARGAVEDEGSVLTLAHERIWRLEEADLVRLLKTKLSKPRREQALTRLADVRTATAQFDKLKDNA
ncbi:hypothetical protein ACODT3_24595 [Streptomyces sp. 4.24]|uniref:hypothetical protein n=1 Tax=Streptomyces tritrimontium TaxID=3406573 RepID=UPI003BB51186